MIHDNELYCTTTEGGEWKPIDEGPLITHVILGRKHCGLAALRRGCIVFDFVLAHSKKAKRLDISPWRFYEPVGMFS